MNQILDKAKEYIGYGLSVIPVNEDKTPALPGWKKFQENRMMNGEIETNFGYALALAVICGSVSGNLEVIDIDCKYDKTGQLKNDFFNMVKDNLPEVINRLPIIKTKNRGWHIYYRCSEIEGNKKLAMNSDKEVLIETRGQGGYVVAPPSSGYITKKNNLSTIPEIIPEERQVLLSIARTFDQSPKNETKVNNHSDQTGLSPFDDYNSRGDVLGLLVSHGWQVTRECQDLYQLTRPGKSKGVSATLFKKPAIFHCFSSSTAFETEKSHSPSAVYCILQCNGDYSEASHRLYDEGYGDRFIKSTNSKKEKRNIEKTPMFPIDGFPTEIQEIIQSCTSVYQTPLDFWAGSLLAATALAIGDKLILKGRYDNVPCLWTCIVGDVSSGKTEPQDFCLKPFHERDKESKEEYTLKKNEYDHIMSLSGKERTEKGYDESPIKPKEFQYILIDFTPEGMAKAHESNTRGIIAYRDELKGWIDDFGRYGKSGEQSNMLSIWSQKPVVYNRKNSDSLRIDRPIVNVLGGMQPDLLSSLAKDNRAENGFLPRIIFIFPDSTPKPPYSNNRVPPEVYQKWKGFVYDLLDLPETTELYLTQQAEKVYELWYNENKKKYDNEDSGYLKGVFGKFDIISLRVAIIIKGMNLKFKKDYEKTISAETMRAAISITEYFRATAIKVYDRIFTRRNSVDKNDVIAYLKNNTEMTDKQIVENLKTSRSQIGRVMSNI